MRKSSTQKNFEQAFDGSDLNSSVIRRNWWLSDRIRLGKIVCVKRALFSCGGVVCVGVLVYRKKRGECVSLFDVVLSPLTEKKHRRRTHRRRHTITFFQI